jgi:hypothetical protein
MTKRAALATLARPKHEPAAPPPAAAARGEEAGQPLNFRVSPDFRRRFRRYAAEHDLRLSQLLVLAFEAYVQGRE